MKRAHDFRSDQAKGFTPETGHEQMHAQITEGSVAAFRTLAEFKPRERAARLFEPVEVDKQSHVRRRFRLFVVRGVRGVVQDRTGV